MNLTDDAKALADAQPVIDVTEVATASREDSRDLVPTNIRDQIHGGSHTTAIEAAANAALTMPGIPGGDEFLALAMQARILCLSGAAPKAVRNNPHLAFHMAMVGRDLNISPSASLELIDVIEGRVDRDTGEKQLRLSLSPQLLNGQIRRLGLGSIRPRVSTPEECIAVAYGPDGEELGESVFTWEDARMAGLVGAQCQPGEHVKETRRAKGGGSYESCGCNQGYITYPKRMLWWRAGGFAADDFFPEASLGMYAPEALGAMVDEDGRPVDPANIALPEGYEPTQTVTPTAAPSIANEVAPEDERDGIRDRIMALPPPASAELKSMWKKPNPDGTPMLWPLKNLPNRQVKSAHALIDAVEKRATAGEWGAWVGHVTEPTPTADVADDPECIVDDCTEPVTIFDDDGAPWCADHAPITDPTP